MHSNDVQGDPGSELAAAAGGDFYVTAEKVGIPESMVDDIVGIFSGEFDFHRDLAGGFTCSVLYEMQFDGGQISKPGIILAVALLTPKRNYSAYHYEERAGADGYYAANGRPMKSEFLKSPIPFSRVTSQYSVRRFHPILNTWRAHRGIDFAAPAGTPVRSTAHGVLGFSGVRGAYGNLVTIRHAGGLSTYYGHLQDLRPDLRIGQRIRQGETIATVGSTGLATGPHLHYELRRNDVPIDPGQLNASPRNLSTVHGARFQKIRIDRDLKLASVYRTHFVTR